jgi:hypothetical protein
MMVISVMPNDRPNVHRLAQRERPRPRAATAKENREMGQAAAMSNPPTT